MLETGKKCVDEWKQDGVSVSLISMPSIKPFDSDTVVQLIEKEIPILVVEEHNVIDGLGTAV